jgi:hypothetical protein
LVLKTFSNFHSRHKFFPFTIDKRRARQIKLHNFRENKGKPPKRNKLRGGTGCSVVHRARFETKLNASVGEEKKSDSNGGEWSRREETTTAKRGKQVSITWQADGNSENVIKLPHTTSPRGPLWAKRNGEKLHNANQHSRFIFTCVEPV